MAEKKQTLRLTFWQWLRNKDYVLNTRTKQIHYVPNQCKCFKDFSKKNQRFLTKNQMKDYVMRGYRICPHCMTDIKETLL